MKKLALIIVLGIALVSCKKEATVAPTKQELFERLEKENKTPQDSNVAQPSGIKLG